MLARLFSGSVRICLLSLLFLQSAWGQSSWNWNLRTHSELTWEVIETDNFRIIYHQGLDAVARDGAAIAEAYYPQLLSQLSVKHLGTIELIFIAEDEITNGFARPDRRIVIWVSQNDAAGWFLGSRKWLGLVLAHEIQHIVTLAGLRTWLGIWNLLAVPSWFLEGMAEYETESWRVGRSDRRLKIHSYRNKLGDLDPHDAGFAKILYLADRFGDSTLADIVHHRDTLKIGPLKVTRPYSFKRAFKEQTGESTRAFQDSWRRTMQTYYFSVLGQRESAGEVGRSLPLAELRALRGLSISPDTTRIAAIGRRNNGMRDWGLYVINRDTTRQIDEVHFGVMGYRRSASDQPAWSLDGNTLAVSEYHRGSHGSLVWDIRLIDLRTGQARWLTREGRAHDPVWSPDGRQLLYVAHPGRASNLYLTTASGPPQQLTHFTGDIQVQDPQWSPDGRKIAFAIQQTDGPVNIAIVDSAGSDLRLITQGPATDLLPLWTPAGDALVFTSFRNGTANLYQIPLEGGEAVAMTDVAEGIYGVQILAGSAEVLAMTSPDVDSVRVRRIPLGRRAEPTDLVIRDRYSRWRNQATGSPRLEIVAELQPATAQAQPYRWWRTWKPLARLVLPVLPDISAIGMWGDALGKQQLFLAGEGRLGSAEWGGLGSWVTTAFKPFISLNIYHNASWQIQGYGQKFLLETLSGADLSAALPINFGHRVAANHLLSATLRLRQRVPAVVGFDQLTAPVIVKEGGWVLGYRWKVQRPHRRNGYLPDQGFGVRLNWAHFLPEIYGDWRYGRLTGEAFGHLKIAGPLVLFSRWAAAAQYGTVPPQDRIGLLRKEPFLLHPGLAGPLGHSIVQTVETHSLRGLPEAILGGRVAMGSHELRLPVIRRLPLNIFGVTLTGVTVALFTDYGAVWTTNDRKTALTYGGELKVNLTLGRVPILTLALGQAVKLGIQLQTGSYLRLGMIQPF